MQLTYTVGDATDPQRGSIDERAVIVHCCNDVGAFGAGFVLSLSKRWPKVEAYYCGWYRVGNTRVPISGVNIPFKLGQVQVIEVEDNVAVANLIGQSGCGSFHGLSPIRYGAIEEGLIRLREVMGTSKWSFHAPRFGSGLAGGDWDKIEEILKRVFADTDISITIYDLK